jgi:hypothetical protein
MRFSNPDGGRSHRQTQACLAALTVLVATPALSWTYPEHRDLGTAAFGQLSAEDAATLEALWATARPAFQGLVCERPSAGDQGLDPRCIDFAAFSALAGDHACSPRDLVEGVLPSPWVLGVAAVAARAKSQLINASAKEQRANRLATLNLELQAVDPDYASRAGANNAHFVLARESNGLTEYLQQVALPGAPLNAIGLYLQYHGAALTLADALASETSEGRRATIARDALVLEGFALHWLQDAFAAGHVVGTWGSDAWRKGTHDYYNFRGFDTQTWRGDHTVIFGDANMQANDAQRASSVIASSLAEFSLASRDGAITGSGAGPVQMYSFNACTATAQPEGRLAPSSVTLEALPMAARGANDVHLPRFREELGPFLGAFASGTGALNLGPQGLAEPRPTIDLAAGLRLGFAAPGITGTIGTAKAFIEAGLEQQSAQTLRCFQTCGDDALATLLPRVQARSGLRLGVRVPFFLIPGDLLVLAPLMVPLSRSAFYKVAIAALSGGAIPYERSVLTGAGVFQIIVGREFDLTLYGFFSEALQVLRVGTLPSGEGDYAVARVRSLRFNLPLVEWTPFRSFATNLTFGVRIQLGGGVEVPVSTSVVLPAGGTATAPTTWTLFLRLQTDIQYFIGEREDAR